MHLIKNREKPSFFSSRYFIVWAKRFLTFKQLVKVELVKRLAVFRGAEIGRFSVLDGTKITGMHKNLKVGDSTFIAKSVNFALHARIDIGSFVVVNEGVQLLTASHHVNSPSWESYSKQIRIDDYAWIATNAILLPGVHIGRGAVVGAGAVVRNSVEAGFVVAGNPAVVVAKRSENLLYSPVELYAPYEAWLGKKSLYEN